MSSWSPPRRPQQLLIPEDRSNIFPADLGVPGVRAGIKHVLIHCLERSATSKRQSDKHPPHFRGGFSPDEDSCVEWGSRILRHSPNSSGLMAVLLPGNVLLYTWLGPERLPPIGPWSPSCWPRSFLVLDLSVSSYTKMRIIPISSTDRVRVVRGIRRAQA